MASVQLWVYNIGNDAALEMIRAALGVKIEGIWHTSLYVYGKEYYFMSGIRKDQPGTSPFGAPVKKIGLGDTEVTEKEFSEYLEVINDLYTEGTYHIIRHNCNHFTNEISLRLVNKQVPAYIMDVAKLFEDTPFEVFLSGITPGIQ
ncbi:hypothetical protein NEIG_00471 [Nematocida sp. ERTm5]|nr:hypothetical protein NEIG_00471 [Nematocida sp. ERTm5]